MISTDEIRENFKGVARPNDADIFEHDAEDAEADFFGRSWSELSAHSLDYHAHALSRFSPVGFHYFLPAFMIAAVEHPELGLKDVVLASLCPPKGATSRLPFARHWALLDENQRQTAIRFLRHFAHLNPIGLQESAGALERAIAE